MNDLISWLVQIERKAGDFYRAAAAHFRDDTRLSDFLLRLADDEAWHLRVIEDAAVFVHNGEGTIEPAILLDDITKSRIEDRFSESSRRLAGGSITSGDMLEHLPIPRRTYSMVGIRPGLTWL